MATVILFVTAVLSIIPNVSAQGGNQYYYSSACGPQLQDIPNPASDSCTAFFRCYQSQQFSVRCPAGQAFDFNGARCRPATLVDCPLQLQRFQAPGIPHYMRPAGAADDPRVEIRVIQLGDANNPNNLVFLDGDGQRVPVTHQSGNNVPQTVESQIRTHPVNPYLRRPIHESPVPAPSSGRNPVVSPGGAIPTEGQRPAQNHRPQPIGGRPGPNPNVALPLQ